jgi:dTMP kinase
MHKRDRPPDRFERDELALHEARRRAYLQIAERDPDRCVVIDATPNPDVVALAILDAASDRLSLAAR